MRLLVPKNHAVSWHQLVWLKYSIPIYSFVLWIWMLCLNRLNTKDRLVRWRVISNLRCPLCTGAYESGEHLFSQCNYVAYVRSRIQESLLLYRGGLPWSRELQWMEHHLKNNFFSNQFRKLALGASFIEQQFPPTLPTGRKGKERDSKDRLVTG